MDTENEKEDKGSEMEVENEVCYIRIEAADNGWVVEYTEKKPRQGMGKFEDKIHVEGKKVFTTAQTSQAFDFFKKLKIAESSYSEGEED